MEGGAAVDPKYVKTRADHRVKQFMKILDGIAPSSLLDVGCSQGKITETLGNQLGLEVGKINGCDLLPSDQIDTKGFTYARNEVDRLPYGDNDSEEERGPCWWILPDDPQPDPPSPVADIIEAFLEDDPDHPNYNGYKPFAGPSEPALYVIPIRFLEFPIV